jgi:6-pyruvoyl-tetrahydropterin synthase
MIEIAVTTNVEAAHYDTRGRLHGHSYVVEVWFPEGPDMVQLSKVVDEVASSVDHSLLEDSIGGTRMEDIAQWFLDNFTDATRVMVRRPNLGLSVHATRDKVS